MPTPGPTVGGEGESGAVEGMGAAGVAGAAVGWPAGAFRGLAGAEGAGGEAAVGPTTGGVRGWGTAGAVAGCAATAAATAAAMAAFSTSEGRRSAARPGGGGGQQGAGVKVNSRIHRDGPGKGAVRALKGQSGRAGEHHATLARRRGNSFIFPLHPSMVFTCVGVSPGRSAWHGHAHRTMHAQCTCSTGTMVHDCVCVPGL